MKRNKGIYQIRNAINNKLYIGSTLRDFSGRWKVHKSLLKNHKHFNRHLQDSWNKYGESSFVFEILIEMNFSTDEEILNKEISLINELKTCDKQCGYNSSTTFCINPMKNRRTRGMLGKKHSDESREKIKKNHADFSRRQKRKNTLNLG